MQGRQQWKGDDRMVANGGQRDELGEITVVMQGCPATALGVAAMIRAWINESEKDSGDPGVKPYIFHCSGCNGLCKFVKFQCL